MNPHLYQEIIPENTLNLPWPSGSPTSSAVDLRPHGFRFVTLNMFSGWTDSLCAIQVSLDGTAFSNPMRGTGGSILGITGMVTGAGWEPYQCPPEWIYAGAYPFVRLCSVSGTGSGIPQASARTCSLRLGLA